MPFLLGCVTYTCVAQVGRHAEVDLSDFKPNFYVPGVEPLLDVPREAARLDPDFEALPDSPLPHFEAETALLNLTPPPGVPPTFQPADTMWGFQQSQKNQIRNTPSKTTSTAQDNRQSLDNTSLAIENSDFGNMSINGMDVGAAYIAVQRMLPPGENLNAREIPVVDPASPDYHPDSGPYHWSGLFAQSLLFNVFENTFRAASDDQIRDLLAKKPFWHDYAASMKQFNMRRWNDGDDFLVNYVGHPLQGAVAGYIEIQNDPQGRQLEIGSNPAYWRSRFHAFLWSAIYSTHSEIGFLGEAGIGNEGGWTYPLKCEKGCPEWNSHMKFTNNTGWVDFTITPVVGTLWLLAEDALDRYVSDRVQGGESFNMGAMFLRAALNPARSMANAMRFQAPWYRDNQHDPDLENSFIVHVQPSDDEIAEAGRFRRFAIAPYFHTMPMGSSADPCTLCFGGAGIGFGADYAINHWLSLSFAAESQSGLLKKAPTPNGFTAEGSSSSIGGGLRFVHEGRFNTISLAVRPTLVTEQIQMPLTLDERHNTYVHPTQEVEHAAVALVFTNDYKINKTLALRTSIRNTIVRYKSLVEDPPGIGKPPYLSFLSHDEYTNKSNWSCETGPVIRF